MLATIPKEIVPAAGFSSFVKMIDDRNRLHQPEPNCNG
jgi:hypothetical protein